MERLVYTIDELARMLGVSRRTVDRRIADGTIVSVHLGPRVVRITTDEVDRLLRGRASGPT